MSSGRPAKWDKDMTREVVQSDIELARGLMDAGCQDGAIVAWLRWRGVGVVESAQLVEALHQRRPIKPKQPGAARSAQHSSRRRRSLQQHRRSPPRGFLLRERRRQHRRFVKRIVRGIVGILAILFVLCCFGYVGYYGWQRAKQNKARHRPEWEERVWRWENGLPDTVSDDLKKRAEQDKK
jgi:hypothetical protein